MSRDLAIAESLFFTCKVTIKKIFAQKQEFCNFLQNSVVTEKKGGQSYETSEISIW
jgi:uncharacterized cupin superfamily protein